MVMSVPLYGQRLLPSVVDNYAREDPERIYGKYAVSNKLSDGFQVVTMAQLASAVNFVAWSIQQSVGTSSTFNTIAYMGASDFRYAIFVLAAIKCGFKVGTRYHHLQAFRIADNECMFSCQARVIRIAKSRICSTGLSVPFYSIHQNV